MMPNSGPLIGCLCKVGSTKSEIWSLYKSLSIKCASWQSHYLRISNQTPHMCLKLTSNSVITRTRTGLSRHAILLHRHYYTPVSVWGDSCLFHRHYHMPVSLSRNNLLSNRCYHRSYHVYKESPPVPLHVSVKKSPRVVHGEVLTDDFQWMQDPEFVEKFNKYMEEENRFTDKSLGDSSLQKQMISEMSHIDGRFRQIDPFTIIHDKFEYRRDIHEDGSVVYYRKAVDDKDDTLCILSISELLKRYNYPPQSAVSDLKVSPCGQYAACMVEIDNETYTTHVIKLTRKGGEFVDVLPGIIRFEFGRNQTIFYTTPRSSECLRAALVWKHQIGQRHCQDHLIYHEDDNRFFVDLYPTQDGRYISITSSTMQTMTEVRLIDTRDLTESTSQTKLVWPRQDALEYFVEHKDDLLYILTNWGDGWQVFQVPVEDIPCQSTSSTGKPLFNTSFDKIGGFEVVGDYCVVSVIEPEGVKLAVQSITEPLASHECKLGAHVCNLVHTPRSYSSPYQFHFAVSSPVQPPVYYSYEPHTSVLTMLPGQDCIIGDGSKHFTCIRTMCVSKDETHVPITLFHKHGMTLDGSNPLFVSVYGAYGADIEMDYSPEKIMLLERGWIIAYCHVRGGGELGRNWYEEGRQLNKHHVIEDFESCITHLHNTNYSKPMLTAAYGVSAGGLPVAALCNNSPHLIKAAILKVPFVDVLTTMLDPSLDLTMQDYDEYGDPKADPAVFDAIKKYCPYYNIHNKQHYPSILVTTTLTDRRVPPWGPVKYVAKLRSMQSCPDLLLQVDQDGGHFGSADTDDKWTRAAREWMFLFKALNLPRR